MPDVTLAAGKRGNVGFAHCMEHAFTEQPEIHTEHLYGAACHGRLWGQLSGRLRGQPEADFWPTFCQLLADVWPTLG